MQRGQGMCVLMVAIASLASCSKSKKSGSSGDPAAGAGTINVATDTSNAGNGVNTSGRPSTVAGVQAAAYTANAAPGKLAIELPQTLSATPGAAALRLDDGDDDTPDRTKAFGYQKLIEKTSRISPLVAGLTERLFEIDAVLAPTEAECDARLGAAWTSCVSPAAVAATFSAEMFIGTVTNVGEAVLGEAAVLALKAKIGTSVSLGTATITKISGDPAGYTRCVELAVDSANGSRYCFNAKDIRVTNRFQEDRDVDGSGELTTVSGTQTLEYVDDHGVFTLTEDTQHGASSVSDKFTIKKDPDAAGGHGVFFTATSDERQEKRPSFTIKQDGLADDAGGFVATTYTWIDASSSTITLSGATEADATYGIFPSAQAVTLADADSELGVVRGGPSVSFTYDGPIPAPAGLKLWKFADDNTVSYSGITVTAIDPVKESFYYDEEFDGKGNLGFWCYKETRTGTCSAGTGTENAYAERYHAIHTPAGAFDLGAILLTLTGPQANAAAMTGADFVIMPAYFDMNATTPFDYDWQAAQLARGTFSGDAEHLSASDFTDYALQAYNSAVGAYAAVKVYRFDYTAEGVAKFTEMTGVQVGAQ